MEQQKEEKKLLITLSPTGEMKLEASGNLSDDDELFISLQRFFDAADKRISIAQRIQQMHSWDNAVQNFFALILTFVLLAIAVAGIASLFQPKSSNQVKTTEVR